MKEDFKMLRKNGKEWGDCHTEQYQASVYVNIVIHNQTRNYIIKS